MSELDRLSGRAVRPAHFSSILWILGLVVSGIAALACLEASRLELPAAPVPPPSLEDCDWMDPADHCRNDGPSALMVVFDARRLGRDLADHFAYALSVEPGTILRISPSPVAQLSGPATYAIEARRDQLPSPLFQHVPDAAWFQSQAWLGSELRLQQLQRHAAAIEVSTGGLPPGGEPSDEVAFPTTVEERERLAELQARFEPWQRQFVAGEVARRQGFVERYQAKQWVQYRADLAVWEPAFASTARLVRIGSTGRWVAVFLFLASGFLVFRTRRAAIGVLATRSRLQLGSEGRYVPLDSLPTEPQALKRAVDDLLPDRFELEQGAGFLRELQRAVQLAHAAEERPDALANVRQISSEGA